MKYVIDVKWAIPKSWHQQLGIRIGADSAKISFLPYKFSFEQIEQLCPKNMIFFLLLSYFVIISNFLLIHSGASSSVLKKRRLRTFLETFQ